MSNLFCKFPANIFARQTVTSKANFFELFFDPMSLESWHQFSSINRDGSAIARRIEKYFIADKKRIAAMRINSKGQVTIPARIREQAGLLPNTEVEFAYDGSGQVRLFRARRRGKRKSRGKALVEHMRGKGDVRMTTDEITVLMRATD